MRTHEERAFLHDVETGRGKMVAVLVAAFLGVALVLWAVAVGFHGRHYHQDARALARPLETPTQPAK
jgi:hypothetical protein